MTKELPNEEKKELPEHTDSRMIEHEEVKELEGPQKVRELEERLIRLAADFENFKKRTEKEHIQIKENSGANIILRMLPIIDEFGIALKYEGNDQEFRSGIIMIFDKLMSLLKSEGLEEMKDEYFDPHRHDAIKTEDGEPGKIVETVQKGYMFKGKVLRHAKVIVGEKNE